jgi:hypothetical protein
MLKIVHRINTIAKLKQIPHEYGVEVDVRYAADKLILNHDPFVDGEDFENWLDYYQHAFIILNIKSEGIEERTIEAVIKRGITDYFLLDLSIPFMVKQIKKGNHKLAVRFSEYEPIESVFSFNELADWIWVDCFTDFPLTVQNRKKLEAFKICLVSPELQGHSSEVIKKTKQRYSQIRIDAVCTRNPELWS